MRHFPRHDSPTVQRPELAADALQFRSVMRDIQHWNLTRILSALERRDSPEIDGWIQAGGRASSSKEVKLLILSRWGSGRLRTEGLGKAPAVGVVGDGGNLVGLVGAVHQGGKAGRIPSEPDGGQLLAMDHRAMGAGDGRDLGVLWCRACGRRLRIDASGLGKGEQQPSQAVGNGEQQRVRKRDQAEEGTAQTDSDSIHKDPRRTRSEPLFVTITNNSPITCINLWFAAGFVKLRN